MLRNVNRALTTGALMLGLLATAACEEEIIQVQATQEAVAGNYRASEFSATDTTTNERTNLLLVGSNVALTLSANGTTSGQVTVPANVALQLGLGSTGSFTGSFTIEDGKVRIQPSGGASFLSDMRFDVQGDRLVATSIEGSTRLRLVLERE